MSLKMKDCFSSLLLRFSVKHKHKGIAFVVFIFAFKFYIEKYQERFIENDETYHRCDCVGADDIWTKTIRRHPSE